jgi:hypothetical protein
MQPMTGSEPWAMYPGSEPFSADKKGSLMFKVACSSTLTKRLLAEYPDLLNKPVCKPMLFGVCFLFYVVEKARVVQVYLPVGNFERWFYMANTRFNTQFVNLKLTAELKPQFVAWADDNAADTLTLLNQVVAANYKVSCNMDEQNDCFIVSVTGTPDNRYNRNLCMTSRSNDLLEALLMMLYKVIVLCDMQDWGEAADTNNNWG